VALPLGFSVDEGREQLDALFDLALHEEEDALHECLVLEELARAEVVVERPLQVVEGLVKVPLPNSYLRYLEQRIPRELLRPPAGWGQTEGAQVVLAPSSSSVGTYVGVLNDLLEVQNGLIVQALLLQDLSLVEMGPRILVVVFEQHLEVRETLLKALKLVEQYCPLK
jgi:hypothetical protein